MSLTVLIDAASGNLHSAAKAFQRMTDAAGGGQVAVTSDPDLIARADRIVLPGDGAFPACRAALDQADGLIEALGDAVIARGRPFLGICVGMQMLASEGEEYRPTPGLGWIDGRVHRITPGDPALKVPHMGWNAVECLADHPVLAGFRPGDHAYFVHSYQMTTTDPAATLAGCDYGGRVTAIIGRDTIVGTQFHPEKSSGPGLRLIANFLGWRP